MIGFFIKKWFFDLWDNLLVTMIFNIIFVLPLSAWLLLPELASAGGPLVMQAISMVMFMVLFVIVGLINHNTHDFVTARRFSFSNQRGYLRTSLAPSLALGAVSYFLILFFQFGVPFYNDLNPTFGLFIIVFFFWLAFFLALAAQWYWPLNAQIEPKVRKLARKSLLLLLDNTAFSLFMALGAALIFVLSVATLSLFPGITGLVLWFQVGLKLRMYKYDYLETLGADTARKKVVIPWEALLAADREQIGPRSLKGMFFPWKE